MPWSNAAEIGSSETFLIFFLNCFKFFSAAGLVHFVRHDQARSFEQRRVVKLQFLEQLLVIVPRRAVVRAGHVEQQHQDFAALDVAQKRVAEADVSGARLQSNPARRKP